MGARDLEILARAVLVTSLELLGMKSGDRKGLIVWKGVEASRTFVLLGRKDVSKGMRI